MKTIGHCQVIQMDLDRARRERLNIGVIFTPKNPNQRIYKLIDNIDVFKARYTDKQINQIHFLLEQTKALLDADELPPAGWNAIVSDPMFNRGDSPESILQRNFLRLVVPSRETEEKQPTETSNDAAHRTNEVKNDIKKSLKNKGYERLWSNTPIQVQLERTTQKIDVPIRYKTTQPNLASIFSIWYARVQDMQRNAHRAITEMQLVKQSESQSVCHVFMLRPSLEEQIESYTKDKKRYMQDIENTVDMVYAVLKTNNINLHVYDNNEAITQKIIADAS